LRGLLFEDSLGKKFLRPYFNQWAGHGGICLPSPLHWEAQIGLWSRPACLKITTTKKDGGVIQVVEHLPRERS
jgi:hypothetical protein